MLSHLQPGGMLEVKFLGYRYCKMLILENLTAKVLELEYDKFDC